MDTRRNDRGFDVRRHSSIVNSLGPAARRIREDSCSVEINLRTPFQTISGVQLLFNISGVDI